MIADLLVLCAGYAHDHDFPPHLDRGAVAAMLDMIGCDCGCYIQRDDDPFVLGILHEFGPEQVEDPSHSNVNVVVVNSPELDLADVVAADLADVDDVVLNHCTYQDENTGQRQGGEDDNHHSRASVREEEDVHVHCHVHERYLDHEHVWEEADYAVLYGDGYGHFDYDCD